MKVGAFLPPWGPTASVERVELFASAAESNGYHSLWVGDHVAFPRGVASSYSYREGGSTPFDPDDPHLEPLTLLAYIAARTREIRLGTSVFVLPMRNPVVSAGQLGNLQALSRGRLQLGIGSGWMREEFEALGADFARRGAVTDEYVALLRHLWAGSTSAFRGEHYEVRSLGLRPLPDPPIPISVGGNSEVAMRRAARLGDGWQPLRLAPRDAGTAVRRLHELAAAQGRDPGTLSVSLRAPLLDLETSRRGPDGAAAGVGERCADLLAGYREAGVDEFIVEFPYPGTPAERQIDWLQWLKDERPALVAAQQQRRAARR